MNPEQLLPTQYLHDNTQSTFQHEGRTTSSRAIDSCQLLKETLCSVMSSVIGFPSLNDYPYTHVHADNTN